MGKPGEVAVKAGRVDDDEIHLAAQAIHGAREDSQLDLLVFADGVAPGGRQVHMLGHQHIATAGLGRGAAIADVAGQGLLTAIDVNGGDPVPQMQQIDRQMQRGGGFARATFFVADHNDMRAALGHFELQISRDPVLPISCRHG